MNQILRPTTFNAGIDTAWSGIQTLQASSAHEALQMANLDWTVKTEPLSIYDGLMEVPSHRAIVRQDNNTVLGVVGNKYTPIQNQASLGFFDDVAESLPDFTYVSAGSINKGKRVWLLADFGGFDAQHGDEVRKQILLYTSHDGTSAMSYVFVPMRVFCNNQIASLLRGEKFFKIRHSGSASQRIQSAKQVAGHAIESYSSIEDIYTGLARKPLTQSIVDKTMEAMLPLEGVEGRTLTRRENTRREILALLDEGMGIPEHPTSAFSLYNAFSEYYSHHTQSNGSSDEIRKERRWSNNVFGKNAKAMSVVTEMLISA